MLNIEGSVTSGLKKAGMFMQKETYKKQYLDKLGFEPFVGTLNIKLKHNVKINIKEEYTDKLKVIRGNESLGDVYFLSAYISNNEIRKKGAILFPTKTVHEFDTLEFVAEEKLREVMKLNDESSVIVSIDD